MIAGYPNEDVVGAHAATDANNGLTTVAHSYMARQRALTHGYSALRP